MNFALLGDDVALFVLVQAIKEHPEHELTHAVVTSAMQAELMQTVPSVRIVAQWEDLLAAESVDAVLLSGSQSRVLEGAKQLATDGKTILLFPTAKQDATLIYELLLIHDDNNVLLFPVIPMRVHRDVVRLQTLMQNGSLGTVRHLQMQREVKTENGKESSSLLSWADVDAALLRDSDLLRSLGGNYDRVTAIASGTEGNCFAMMTVTLSGDNLPDATWTLKPATLQPNWNLSVTVEKGRLALSGGPQPNEATLDVDQVDVSSVAVEETGADVGPLLLARFDKAVAGQPVKPDWTDLMRAFEIMEASHRSVRRRRTIELHFESQSERSLFKTQMTAIGCGLLTFTFLAVLVVLLIGAMFDPKEMSEGAVLAMKIARVVVFAPLFLFLLFQFLLFITRPSSDGNTS